MPRITFHNEFHHTTATVRVYAHKALRAGWAPGTAHYMISDRQFRRAHKKLCGMADCCCGGIYRAVPEVQNLPNGEHYVYADDVEIV